MRISFWGRDGSNNYGSYTLYGTGTETGTVIGTRNNVFLYYSMYCTLYTRTETLAGNQCFLFYPTQSLAVTEKP